MSDFWVALFFGLGAAGIVYSKMEHRLGAGNAKELWIIVGVSFLLAAFFIYMTMAVVLNIH